VFVWVCLQGKTAADAAADAIAEIQKEVHEPVLVTPVVTATLPDEAYIRTRYRYFGTAASCLLLVMCFCIHVRTKHSKTSFPGVSSGVNGGRSLARVFELTSS
jgi:hypothetical protein